jgi:hypothetical protein
VIVSIVAASASGCGGWWTCQHMTAPDAGERRDRTSGLRWELPRIRTAATAVATRARAHLHRLASVDRGRGRQVTHHAAAPQEPARAPRGQKPLEGSSPSGRPRWLGIAIAARSMARPMATFGVGPRQATNRPGGSEAARSDRSHHADTQGQQAPPGAQ